MRRPLLLAVLSLLATAWLPGIVCAQVSKDATGNDKPRQVNDAEASALGFVAVNHRELIDVLDRLKASNRPEYDKAIKQLQQVNEHLTKLSKEDTELYDAELRLWKVKLRLQLQAARLSVTGTAAAGDELKRMVLEEIDAKADLLALDRKRQVAQLKNLEAEIARLNQSRDKEADARINELKKQITQIKRKTKPAAPPPPSSASDSKSKAVP